MKDVTILTNSGVNVQQSLELFGDMEMYDETLADFLDMSQEKLENLEKHKAANDMPNYAIEVHALKSDARYLGFMTLGDMAYESEMKSKAGDSAYVNENHPKILEEAKKMINLAETYLGRPLTTSIPGLAAQAAAPAQAVAPVAPAETPVQPVAPVAPAGTPVGPVAPVAPAGTPVQPVAPAAPAGTPVQPVAPVAPAGTPVGPVAPVAPAGTPVQPVAPVAPAGTPVQPVAPVAPAGTPVGPVAPVAPMPVEQAIPRQPEPIVQTSESGTIQFFPSDSANNVMNQGLSMMNQMPAANPGVPAVKQGIILIIDDSNLVANFVKKIFSDKYDVLVANDGSKGIEMANDPNIRPKIKTCLVDLYMPNVDGFQVLDNFRENGIFVKTPIAVISGAEDTESIERARSYPIIDILAKPFTDRDVKMTVEKCLAVYF